jgi:glycosyltransferase involved in cell wall biosynthesis
MNKKKILFFHHSSSIGGAGLSGFNVLNAIPKDKYEIVVYCNSENVGMAQIYQNAGYNVIFAGRSPIGFSHYSGGESFILSLRVFLNLFNILKDYNKIKNTIKNENPEIIIVNSMTLAWIGKIAKSLKIETICFFRETYPKTFFGFRNKLIKLFLSNYFDKVSFISNYDLEMNKSIKSYKTTIYNMIDVKYSDMLNKDSVKSQYGLDDKSFHILFVGGISKLKGTLIAIKALNKLKDKNIKLVILGYQYENRKKFFLNINSLKGKINYLIGRDYEAKVRNFIIKNGLEKKIVFFDTQVNSFPFFKACDVLIFPSTKPHQARPIFEAGFAKIPVIVSDFENLKEIIDVNCGYSFKNKDHNQLALLIDKIFQNQYSKELEDLVEENFTRTISRHTKNIYFKKIEHLLEVKT